MTHQSGLHRQACNQARSCELAHEVGLNLPATVGIEDDCELVVDGDLQNPRSLLDTQIIRHRLADRIFRRRQPTQVDRRRA